MGVEKKDMANPQRIVKKMSLNLQSSICRHLPQIRWQGLLKILHRDGGEIVQLKQRQWLLGVTSTTLRYPVARRIWAEEMTPRKENRQKKGTQRRKRGEPATPLVVVAAVLLRWRLRLQRFQPRITLVVSTVSTPLKAQIWAKTERIRTRKKMFLPVLVEKTLFWTYWLGVRIIKRWLRKKLRMGLSHLQFFLLGMILHLR